MADSDLVFSKEEVKASKPKGSLLGAMLQQPQPSKLAPPEPKPEAPAPEGKGAAVAAAAGASEDPEPSDASAEIKAAIEAGAAEPALRYAARGGDADDEGDEGLPYRCKVWMGSGKTLGVLITEVCRVKDLLEAIIRVCGTFQSPSEVEDLVRCVGLFAADETGERDEDCPELDIRRDVHLFGVNTFVMRHRQSKHKQRIQALIPQRSSITIGKALKKGFGDADTRLFQACDEGKLPTVQRLIEKKLATVDARGINSWTPLHYASRSGHYPIVLYLARANADIDMKSKDGWTSLHLACLKGHYDVADILLQNGADMNIKDNQGKTPMDVAVSKDSKEIVELLKEFQEELAEEEKA